MSNIIFFQVQIAWNRCQETSWANCMPCLGPLKRLTHTLTQTLTPIVSTDRKFSDTAPRLQGQLAKNCPTLSCILFASCVHCIVLSKRMEWAIRLWPPLRWTLNLKSVTIEQSLLDVPGKPLETRSSNLQIYPIRGNYFFLSEFRLWHQEIHWVPKLIFSFDFHKGIHLQFPEEKECLTVNVVCRSSVRICHRNFPLIPYNSSSWMCIVYL